MEFEPGNFGVRYGRATGGRVNLVTRDPGERTHALADANLFHATALVEGRSSEDLGIAMAARRSYVDAVVTRALESRDDAPGVSTAPRYYDLQLKAAWKASQDDTVRFDLFGSDDRMVLIGIESDDCSRTSTSSSTAPASAGSGFAGTTAPARRRGSASRSAAAAGRRSPGRRPVPDEAGELEHELPRRGSTTSRRG